LAKSNIKFKKRPKHLKLFKIGFVCTGRSRLGMSPEPLVAEARKQKAGVRPAFEGFPRGLKED
jgi:hypothetical protein